MAPALVALEEVNPGPLNLLQGGLARRRLEVLAGRTYRVAVASDRGLVGDYVLTFIGEVGQEAETAHQIALHDEQQDAQVAEAIHGADDIDLYRYTAPVMGLARVRVRTEDGVKGLALEAYANKGGGLDTPIVRTTDDGMIEFSTTRQGVYFIKVACEGPEPSAAEVPYDLTVLALQDDYGDEFETAQHLPFGLARVADVDGEIERAGDRDMFRITAPISGWMAVSYEAKPFSGLDPFVMVYDERRRILATADDNGANLDSLSHLPVSGGRSYYVLARTARDGTTGEYDLTIAVSEVHKVSVEGSSTSLPAVFSGGDILDTYRFKAPRDGQVTAHIDGNLSDIMMYSLNVYDGDRRISGGAYQADVEFAVEAGRTYVLHASRGIALGDVAYQVVLEHGSSRIEPGEEAVNVLAVSLALRELLRSTVPAEPDEPWLLGILPEECLLYLGWSGTRTADPHSACALECLLADAQVSQYFQRTAREIPQIGARQRRGGVCDGVAPGPHRDFRPARSLVHQRVSGGPDLGVPVRGRHSHQGRQPHLPDQQLVPHDGGALLGGREGIRYGGASGLRHAADLAR